MRNLLNIFVAPISTFELVLALTLFGIMKSLLTGLVLCCIAYFCYAFKITIFGFYLVPFVINLFLFGWALGMFTMGLVLRFGHSAEALVWGIPFLIQPFIPIFYPVDIFPAPLRAFAYTQPATYVFEGMREVLRSGSTDAAHLYFATLLNIAYLVLAAAFLGLMLKQVRAKGFLTRLGMQ